MLRKIFRNNLPYLDGSYSVFNVSFIFCDLGLFRSKWSLTFLSVGTIDTEAGELFAVGAVHSLLFTVLLVASLASVHQQPLLGCGNKKCLQMSLNESHRFKRLNQLLASLRIRFK